MNTELFHEMRRQPIMGFSVDLDRTAIRPVQTGQQLDEGRFAGAILANETVNGTTTHGKRCTGECLSAAEGLGNIAQTNDVVRLTGLDLMIRICCDSHGKRSMQGDSDSWAKSRQTRSNRTAPCRPVPQPMPSFLETSPTFTLFARRAGTYVSRGKVSPAR
ncbi:hypothetical protein D3C80_921940 [compost metagenome]